MKAEWVTLYHYCMPKVMEVVMRVNKHEKDESVEIMVIERTSNNVNVMNIETTPDQVEELANALKRVVKK